MVESNWAEETPKETLLTMVIDAATLAMWTSLATGEVKEILSRSPGAIHYYPSEAEALSESALHSLPGEDARSGVNVAVKFSGRFAASIPA